MEVAEALTQQTRCTGHAHTFYFPVKLFLVHLRITSQVSNREQSKSIDELTSHRKTAKLAECFLGLLILNQSCMKTKGLRINLGGCKSYTWIFRCAGVVPTPRTPVLFKGQLYSCFTQEKAQGLE